MTFKNGFGKCSFYQPMDEKIKTWILRFPAKENPNMEKALFDWLIVLQCDVAANYRLISRKLFGHEVFSAERSLNQQKATRVCIRSMNQSNRSISVRLLFLFCSRVFISRLYENSSNTKCQERILLIPATCYLLPTYSTSFYLSTSVPFSTPTHHSTSNEATCKPVHMCDPEKNVRDKQRKRR